MSTLEQKICIEALSLPSQSRAEIAHRLLVSLEHEKLDDKAEREWKTVIRRRRREIREGKAKLVPADEAMRNALRAIS